MKQQLLFCTSVFPTPHSQLDVLLLAESLRAFGGRQAKSPLWVFTPAALSLDHDFTQRMSELDCTLQPVKIEEKPDIFFSERLQFLTWGEKKAAGKTDLLVWMDANTLVLNDPKELAISPGKLLGYRPVHHLLIGSRIGKPLDPFWDRLFGDCLVPSERLFPMRPVVEDVKMRPYLNAGLVVTRPERGFFRYWYTTFKRLLGKQVYWDFFEDDPRYRLFFHQAVLTGAALHFFDRLELSELPAAYNYPVHLFAQDATPAKPENIDGMATIRHERFYENKDWKKDFPAGGAINEWIAEKLLHFQKLIAE